MHHDSALINRAKERTPARVAPPCGARNAVGQRGLVEHGDPLEAHVPQHRGDARDVWTEPSCLVVSEFGVEVESCGGSATVQLVDNSLEDELPACDARYALKVG
jgi:hypothetical protein